jgi:hypothetical protein
MSRLCRGTPGEREKRRHVSGGETLETPPNGTRLYPETHPSAVGVAGGVCAFSRAGLKHFCLLDKVSHVLVEKSLAVDYT